MLRSYLLVVTALVEAGTGLLLLVWPPGVLRLLLGIEQAAPETLIISRVAGVALLAIGVTCWFGRNEYGSSAQQGLLIGVLIYDVGAAALLAYAALGLSLVGMALWPAVGAHAVLAIWSIICLSTKASTA